MPKLTVTRTPTDTRPCRTLEEAQRDRETLIAIEADRRARAAERRLEIDRMAREAG